jgi:hypothetical protein
MLRRELMRGLKSGAAPLIPLVKEAAREKLPKGGGLNEQVASQKVRVAVRTGARTAGVRLVTTAPDTSQTNAGFVRHPVFERSYDMATGKRVGSGTSGSHRPRGKNARWVRQEIPAAAGWWSETLARAAPVVTPELRAVMTLIADRIQGRV